MAEETETNEAPRDIYWKPVITTLKVIGVFFDVATLMIRMLFNTVFHDSHHGKQESAESSRG